MSRFFITLCSVCLGACGASPQIVYPGTAAYEERISEFAITADQAREIAGRPYGAFGPTVVIEREYLFSEPQKSAKVVLDGTYVNGDTGHMERRIVGSALRGNLLTNIVGYPFGMPSVLPPRTLEARGEPSSDSPSNKPLHLTPADGGRR